MSTELSEVAAQRMAQFRFVFTLDSIIIVFLITLRPIIVKERYEQ